MHHAIEECPDLRTDACVACNGSGVHVCLNCNGVGLFPPHPDHAPDYLPSQVMLNASFPPLVATMKRTEREIAAALIVRACQVHGDRWQAVSPKLIGETLQADVAARTEPMASLSSNPFARPDFHSLVAEGYASGDLATHAPLELTEKAFEAMRRWVSPGPSGRKAGEP